jgi:hypothetical protein
MQDILAKEFKRERKRERETERRRGQKKDFKIFEDFISQPSPQNQISIFRVMDSLFCTDQGWIKVDCTEPLTKVGWKWNARIRVGLKLIRHGFNWVLAYKALG